jgi:hypothetical protein
MPKAPYFTGRGRNANEANMGSEMAIGDVSHIIVFIIAPQQLSLLC